MCAAGLVCDSRESARGSMYNDVRTKAKVIHSRKDVIDGNRLDPALTPSTIIPQHT
jgi:hypothetical protein